MIGGNFIVKNSKKISKRNDKISPENSLPLSINPKQSELISLNYDVNDHVYSIYLFKDPVQRFSQPQFVMNKYFLSNLEKILARIRASCLKKNVKIA